MAKKKAKPEVQTVSTEALDMAIDEVNEQLDLDPEIEKGTDKEMKKELKEAMEDEELFEGDEEFTSATYDVLEALGIEHDCVKVKDVDDSEGKDESGEEEEVIIPKEKQGRMAKRTAKKENKKGETKMKTKTKKTKKIKASKKVVKVNKSKGKKEKTKAQGYKKLGIGTFIVENLRNRKFKKLSNEQIVDRVMKKFPEASTKPANIPGYRKMTEEK